MKVTWATPINVADALITAGDWRRMKTTGVLALAREELVPGLVLGPIWLAYAAGEAVRPMGSEAEAREWMRLKEAE